MISDPFSHLIELQKSFIPDHDWLESSGMSEAQQLQLWKDSALNLVHVVFGLTYGTQITADKLEELQKLLEKKQ